MEQKTKVTPRFEYEGCGFSITILNAPMRKIAGHWALDIDSHLIDRQVVLHLAKQSTRLTGAQLKFFRLWMGATLRDLAARLGVSHVAIHKWEERKAKATGMDINNERVLRAIMFLELGHTPAEALQIITALNEKTKSKTEAMQMDAEELKSA